MKQLDVSDFNKKIKRRPSVIIDVRTPNEYKSGSINGALNFDFFSSDFLENFKELEKTEPLYIYCKSGQRSYNASLRLSDLGFTNVYDLKGGYMSWLKNI